jgi:hypothetical protein
MNIPWIENSPEWRFAMGYDEWILMGTGLLNGIPPAQDDPRWMSPSC